MVEPTDDLDTAMKMIMDDLHTHKWTVFVETGPGKFSAHASLDYFKYYLEHGGSLIFFIEEKMALVVNYDSLMMCSCTRFSSQRKNSGSSLKML